MGKSPCPGVGAQAFRAYVGRRGDRLWRRALLLTAGDRDAAEELLGEVLATTYAGWREDSDDSVETHLATRAMTRAGANAADQSAANAAHQSAANVAGNVADLDVTADLQLGEEARDTLRRLRGLDPAARAALVAAAVDGIADPRSLAVALGRRPRTVRADLARGRAAWPEDTTLALLAEQLEALEDRLDVAPSGGLVDRVLAGAGVGAEHAGRPRWSRWRRGLRGPGRGAASRGPRAAVGFVAAVALVGALAVAHELSSSASAPTSTTSSGTAGGSAPADSATSEPTVSGPSIAFRDLPLGAPARPPAYLAQLPTGGRAYVDSSGAVTLPTADWSQILALTKRGAFVLLGDRDPSGLETGRRLVLVRADHTLIDVLVAPLDNALPSVSGDLVLALPATPRGPSVTTPPATHSLLVRRVSDGRVLAERSFERIQGMTWSGDLLAIGTGRFLRTWSASEGWQDHDLTEDYSGPLRAGNALLFSRTPGPADLTCLRRWTPEGGLDARVLWCDNAQPFPFAADPSGRRVLIGQPPSPGAGDFRWGVLDVVSGQFQALSSPPGVHPMPTTAPWEDEKHVLFTAGPASTGVRCDVETGTCERAEAPADLDPRQ